MPITQIPTVTLPNLETEGYKYFKHTLIKSATPWYLTNGVSITECVAAYAAKGSESLSDSYRNLAHPGTNDIFLGTAPNWDAVSGWKFNGIDQFLATGIIPPNGTWSGIVRFSDFVMTTHAYIFGEGVTNSFFLIGFDSAVNKNTYYNGASINSGTGKFSSGVFGISGRGAYRDGIAEPTTNPDWTGGSGIGIYIGAFNLGDTPTLFGQAKVQALVIYNITLTAAQVLTISNAMAAL